jgi:hypothetical protein
MSLHADLLDQAEQLAKLDPRRPKQANLRRAVSSAYYALFHLLASATSALYVSEAGMVARIVRTLNHAEMKRASTMIANNKLPKAVQDPGAGYTVPADLKIVADALINLQQARHEADYDLSATLNRLETLTFVASARRAFEAWERVKRTDDARIYLACFHLWKRWDEDPR